MDLRQFHGETMADALIAARAALGPAALVVGSRMVPAGGWRGLVGIRSVEISVAGSRQVSENRQPSSGADLVAQLCAVGFERRIATEVAGLAPRRRSRSESTLRAAVVRWSESLAAADAPEAPVTVFVGPPGAGKTTTIAKIAAQHRARTGTRLTVIAADAFRVGAIEQLRLYADIIGAPFVAARTPEEVEAAVAAAKSPVLIDTAGRSPRDEAVQALYDVVRRLPGVRTHLVVPASSTSRDFCRWLDAQAALAPTHAVITKLDDSDPAAPLAGILRERKLRVSFLGNGQRVPEDLLLATPEALAGAFMGEESLVGAGV